MSCNSVHSRSSLLIPSFLHFVSLSTILSENQSIFFKMTTHREANFLILFLLHFVSSFSCSTRFCSLPAFHSKSYSKKNIILTTLNVIFQLTKPSSFLFLFDATNFHCFYVLCLSTFLPRFSFAIAFHDFSFLFTLLLPPSGARIFFFPLYFTLLSFPFQKILVFPPIFFLSALAHSYCNSRMTQGSLQHIQLTYRVNIATAVTLLQLLRFVQYLPYVYVFDK